MSNMRYCTEEFRPLNVQKALCKAHAKHERFARKAVELCKLHPRSMILFLVAFTALLLLPQLVYSTGALQEVIKNLDFAEQADELEDVTGDDCFSSEGGHS